MILLQYYESNIRHLQSTLRLGAYEDQAMKMTKALVDRYRTRANQEHAAPAPMREDYAR